MKFTEVNYEEIGLEKRRKNRTFDLLKDFQNSNIECAEVDHSDYRCAWSCTSTIMQGIRHFHFEGLTAVTKNGKTYLINDTIRLARKQGGAA